MTTVIAPPLRTVDASGRPARRAPFGAVLLAGGDGWRGRAYGLPPKALAAIPLRPLITYALGALEDAGLTQVTVVAHGVRDALAAAIGPRYGTLSVAYAEDAMPRGLAGCLKDVAAAVDAERFVLIEGGVIPRVDVADLVSRHCDSGAVLSIVTSPATSGGPLPDVAGIYVVERAALDYVADSGYQDLKETVLPKLSRAGLLVGLLDAGARCPRVVDLASYMAANAALTRELAGREPDGVAAGLGAQIASGALVIGPVLIGAGARIETGATVVGPAVVGPRARIAAGALVSRSVIHDGAVVGESAILHGCLLAAGASVVPGRSLYRQVHLRESMPAPWYRRAAAFWVRPPAEAVARLPALPGLGAPDESPSGVHPVLLP